MVKHNNQIPNRHFKKKWQFHVKTWFNQPARKARRQLGTSAFMQAVTVYLTLSIDQQDFHCSPTSFSSLLVLMLFICLCSPQRKG